MARRKPPAIVWREGNLIKIKPINSENIYFTDYSEDIYRLVSGVRWRVVLNGYLQGWVNKRLVLLHHLILPKKEGYLTDHINRNKLDNRRSNLRYVNRYESGINRNMQSSNTTGYVGVVWVKRRKKWQAAIRINGNKKWLGYFDNPEDAAQAYINAVDKYYPGILQYKDLLFCNN